MAFSLAEPLPDFGANYFAGHSLRNSVRTIIVTWVRAASGNSASESGTIGLQCLASAFAGSQNPLLVKNSMRRSASSGHARLS